MHASRNLAISNKIAEAIVSVPFADLNADCVGQARHGLQLPKLRCHGIGMIDKDAAP
ncbi:hypothetical protein M747DRAFT_13267 [Aspergillus niger ATCC 13496]|uniref:Uncharacterized protein n=1 Tax=Aspergillus niger ATCC 13496 TaxID=1353008 RepID=A0A370C938_ASPNG|nr:hypothetical protein M747DRAFT_13267 [Aspergillus niger ATCC 13496]